MLCLLQHEILNEPPHPHLVLLYSEVIAIKPRRVPQLVPVAQLFQLPPDGCPEAFFSYLFSGCSWLSISLTCPNASGSLSGATGPPPPPHLLGLGGVGGLGGSVLALPPPKPMSSLSWMHGSLGLLQATPLGAPTLLGLLNLVLGGVTGWP